MEILTAIVGAVTEYTVGPIIRQGGYIIHCKRNIQTLQTRVEELKAARERVDVEIVEADRKGEHIYDDVKQWITKVDEIAGNADELLKDEHQAKMNCMHGFCPNLLTRHQLSRKSTKLVEVVLEFQGKANFPSISYGGRTGVVFLKDYEAFDSRSLTLNRIMDELKNPDINKIGVYGIAGVGKTTLVEEVVRQVIKDELFDDVVIVRDVKEYPDIERIQKEIAEQLGMDYSKDLSRTENARRIYDRLKNKKTFLVLDDIWNFFDLKVVGVPDVAACKILLTSRSGEVLSTQMGTQKEFQLAALEEEECWSLFESKVGDVVRDPKILTVATQVAKRCGGLPILVVTVASALKKCTSPSGWEDALRRLETFQNTGSIKQAFLALEWIYDKLEDEELQSLFLLSGVTTWKNSIFLDDLLKLAMGLDLLKGVNTMKEARNSLLSLVEKLKFFCLLLEDNGDTSVRMHDLVNDVANEIASRDQQLLSVACGAKLKDWPKTSKCGKISIKSDSLAKLSEVLECQKLEMFHLHCEDEQPLQVPNGLFANMEKLKVLSLKNVKNLASLGFLKNLQTLCLDECEEEDIAVVGELSKLEILSLGNSGIKQLPEEIGQLTCLRLLDLTRCFSLEVIAPNVLSRLTRLEDLRMRYSPIKWEAEHEGERSNASLSELKHLSLLTALEIKISNPDMLPKDLFSDKLERFYIHIGNHSLGGRSINTLKLQFTTGDELDQGLKMLVKRSEVLTLQGGANVNEIAYQLEGDNFRQVKHLQLRELDTTYIINSEVVCTGLTTLEVTDCHGIKFLFSSSMARSLVQLRALTISGCRSMVEIASTQEDNEENNIVNMFSKLESLTLRELPSLVGFYSGSYAGFSSLEEALISNGQSKSTTITKEIEDADSKGHLGVDNAVHYFLFDKKVTFPSLERLWLEKLPKLEAVWQNQLAPDSFSRLKQVEVGNCSSLINLFVSFITERLDALKTLIVWSCPSLEVVCKCGGLKFKETHDPSTKELKTFNCCPNLEHFSILRSDKLKYIFQMEERLETVPKFVFPKVTYLYFSTLPQFKSIYPGMHVSQWPSLQNLNVDERGEVKIIAGELSVYQEKQESAFHSNPIEQPLILIEKVVFSSLTTLEVIDCHGIKFMFSSSMARSLVQLKTLTISRCRSMVEIVSTQEDEEKNNIATMFSKLESLTLRELPSLVGFCSGSYAGFSSLEEALISNGQSKSTTITKEIEDGDSKHHLGVGNVVHYLLFDKKVVFSSLTTLEVIDCHGIKFMFSSSMARSLVQLKTLTISRCRRMVEIVSTQEDEEKNNIATMFSKLESLTLRELPSLVGFCSGSYAEFSSLEEALISNGQSKSTTITKEIEDGDSKHHLGVGNAVHYFLFDKKVVFSSLTTLKVIDCHGIKFLFSSSMARSLVQLKTLTISRCRSMVEIVSTQEDEEKNNIATMFSKLESLTLKELPSLVGFCSGSYAGLSSLEEALISNGQSKSTTITKEIEDGDSKDHLGVGNVVHYFLFDKKVTFPSLERLQLKELPKLEAVWQNQLAPDSFCRIREVRVDSCPSLINLFVPCIMERLDALETLRVGSCPSLEVVFKCGGLKFKETHDPSTKELKTFNCCPNLEYFSILRSDKLKYIFQAEERLETTPKFVFPKVTYLCFSNLPQFKSIYPGTHISQWPSLQKLNVDECGEVKVIAGELSVYQEKQESASHSNPIKQPLILIEKPHFILTWRYLYLRSHVRKPSALSSIAYR